MKKLLVILLCIGAIAVGILISFVPFSHMQLTVIVLWIFSIGLMLLPLYIDTRILNRKLDWFSPLLFNLLISILGVARPLFIAFDSWQTAWYTGSLDQVASLLIRTILLGILAQIMLLVGYYAPIGVDLSLFLPELPGEWDKQKLQRAAATIIVLGLSAYVLIMFRSGGLLAYLNNLSSRRKLLEGQFYIQLFTLLIPLIAYMLLAYTLQQKKSISKRLILLFVLIFVLMSTFGGRGSTVRIPLFALGVYSLMRYRVKLWQLLLLAIIATQFLQTYESVRISTRDQQLDDVATAIAEGREDQSFIETLFNGGEGIDRTMVVINGVPDVIPFQYFTTYFRVFTTIIPRQIWADKPGLGEAAIYAPLFGLDSDGKFGVYPAGTVGDFYLQLGAVGVAIGFFVSGVLRRLSYEYLLRFPTNPSVVVIYLIALVGEVFKLRNQYIVQFLILFVPALLIIRYISPQTKRNIK